MKLNKFMVAAIALGFVSVANAAPKDQGHGEIEFHGTIIDAPCSIETGDEEQKINMGSIANVSLKDGGKSAAKEFFIHLVNCDNTTAKTVTTTFTGPISAGNADLIGLTGSASGASLGITDGSGTLIKLDTATKPQGIGNHDNTLNFTAFLQGDAGATIVPGSFSTTTNFTLDYQ